MILNIFAGCIIFLSALLCADNLYKSIILREKELVELRLFFESVKNSVVSYKDIAECIRGNLSSFTFTTKKYFEMFCDKLYQKPCSDYYAVWCEVKNNMFPLIDDDEKILDEFFRKSCEISVLTATEKVDDLIKSLECNIDSISHNKLKNRKLYYNTGICIGLLTVILLI